MVGLSFRNSEESGREDLHSGKAYCSAELISTAQSTPATGRNKDAVLLFYSKPFICLFTSVHVHIWLASAHYGWVEGILRSEGVSGVFLHCSPPVHFETRSLPESGGPVPQLSWKPVIQALPGPFRGTAYRCAPYSLLMLSDGTQSS